MLQNIVSRQALPTEGAVSGAFKVDVSRGERIGRVSSEWFSRPDDERYLSLSSLHYAVHARAERATARTVETRSLRVEANRNNAERIAIIAPGRDEPIAPTHWSFGQMCSLIGAPAGYLRQLPAPLAGINLQHGLLSHRGELVKTLEADDGRVELRAVKGPDYIHLGSRTGRRCDVLCWQWDRRHAVESARCARLVDDDPQPVRRDYQGHHHALCQRPGRVPLPGRRHPPHRGGSAAQRRA